MNTCYEFVHECDGPLMKELCTITDVAEYFIVCVGLLNYMYCDDKSVFPKLRQVLQKKKIFIHLITPLEMMEVLDSKDFGQYQVFYGSKMLYDKFKESNKKVSR